MDDHYTPENKRQLKQETGIGQLAPKNAKARVNLA